MAKRKSKKKPVRRRRRVGALNMSASSPLVLIAGAAAGFFLGDTVNGKLDSMLQGKVNGKIVGAAEGIGGYLLARKLGKKSVIKSAAGGFLIGMGVKKLGRELGVINGFRSVPVVGSFRSVPVIGKRNMAGYITPSGYGGGALSGYEVPQPMSRNIVGSVSSGSGINASDR